MPTMKPRITVTLNQGTYGVIMLWAKLQKRSGGKVISELLDSMVEPLERAADLMEAAAKAPDDVKRGMAQALMSVETDVLAAYDRMQGGFDRVDGALARMEKSESTPVPVTRGSGTENTHQFGAKKSRKP